MAKLRRAIWDLLQGTRRVIGSGAGLACERYRQAVIRTFLTKRNPSTLSLAKGLTVLLNGDYTSTDIIHYCNSCCSSRDSMLQGLRKYVLRGLCGRAVRLFPRSN
eukprot:11179886-Lingulodinium_polyedra.AAC.1